MLSGRMVDLSQTVDAGTPVFPGDGPVRVTILDQSGMHLSRIEFSVHTGTHMDAPFHFFTPARPSIACRWRAVWDRRGSSISARSAWDRNPPRAFGGATPSPPFDAHAAVLHTGWSKQWGAPNYFSDHPCLAADAATFLVDCGVQLVGVDMPSVDRAPYPAHRILLGAGLPIVENLTNLDALGAGLFQLIVLPLSSEGATARPCARWP